MLIILEGPDCVAKTTLANRLTDMLVTFVEDGESVELKYAGPPLSHPLDEYELALGDYRPETGRHVVCDRWHLGEIIYPPVLKRPTQLDNSARLHIDLFLQSRGALIVNVTSSIKRIQRCIAERGDDLITAEMIPQLKLGFDDCLRTSLVPSLRVDGYNVSDVLIRYIIIRAQNEGLAATHLNTFTTYVGPAEPQLLLFGDVRHNWTDDPTDLRTAFMPYPATSGQYLLNALARTWPIDKLHQVGIANACDVDDPKLLWTTLGKPKVVTMGVNARRTIKFANHHVPHPQWQRRFRHDRASDYATTILMGKPPIVPLPS